MRLNKKMFNSQSDGLSKTDSHFKRNIMQPSGKKALRIWLSLAGCLLLMTISCTKFKKQDDKNAGKAIARVYDRYLYLSDIVNIVPKGTSHNDSLTIIRNYVQNWVRQQIVLKKAEDNLDEEDKNVEKKLEEYRNSLITYNYERELIRQKLDTVINSQEIENYYNEHPNNFQLKDNIIKVLYLRIPKTAPKIDKVRNWYKSDAAKDRKLLEDYCIQFAHDYNFNDEEWLLFDDLLKKVPIETYDKEQFLRNNRFIEIPDSSSIYLVNIKGFKIKESQSPLSFESDNIRNFIINKRKLEMIRDMEKSAYDNAINNHEVEILLPKK
jgi:hypothetical protein